MATAMLERATRMAFEAIRDPRSDSELLTRFCRERDGTSFSELVRRHGPTVLGVCRRVLGDHHAAEDAFQASFLVLARRADSVRPPGMLGSWLYGVAYRTALKARGRQLRRREVEAAYAERLPPQMTTFEACEPDLRTAIDEHLYALPDRYRLPLVLCGVQGLGKSEAAERLGLPEGTVSSRLARGRAMLRDRLVRKGFVVPAAGIATVMMPGSLIAKVPSNLASATSSAGSAFGAGSTAGVSPGVLSLTHEVLSTMTLIHWKLLSVLAVAVVLAGGFTGFAEDKKPAKPGTTPDKPRTEGDKPKKPGTEGQKPTPKPDAEKPKKPGEGDKKPEGQRFQGKVEKVDAAGNSLTISHKSDKGASEKTFKFTSDAKIMVDGKAGKLGDIPSGVIAIVMVPGKDQDAVGVMVSGAQLSGIIAKVDGSTITVDAGGQEKKSLMSFTVGSDTSLMIDGKQGTAADLKPGLRVGVQLSMDGKTALKMKAGEARGDGDKKPVKKPDGDKTPEAGTKPVKKPDGDKTPEAGTKPVKKPDAGAKPVKKPDGDK